MSIFKELKAYTREFTRHWLQYLMLFLSLNLINQFIVIPLFRYVTTFVLQASAIPFVSYQNVVTIITTHTLVFVILIIELLLLLVVIYAQFAYLLPGQFQWIQRSCYSTNQLVPSILRWLVKYLKLCKS